ncbi:MAG: energy transducer TonB [Gammaproteobacteria bacterium]|nr:energy transducer TonB [Gammaproteobacteria bacterium]
MAKTRSLRSLPPSGRDQLIPFLLVATLAHALVVKTVGFALPEVKTPDSPPALEVTLAQYQSDRAPEQADFLGQANQEGSGDADQAKAPSSPEQAEFPDPNPQELASAPEARPQQSANTPVLSTRAPQPRAVNASEAPPQPAEPEPPRPSPGLLASSLEIASLAAQLDEERQLSARRPRKRFISSAAIKSAADAAYLDQWRRRVERIGNLNYPSAARSQQLYGELVVAVTLFPNGEVKHIAIEQSSGQRLLDDAARRIVSLAAPFAPLPRELKADELTIIKTWRFEPGNTMATR